MIARLVRLHARRTAGPVSLAIVAAVTLLAARGAAGGRAVLSTSTVFAQEVVEAGHAGARSTWIAAIAATLLLALLAAGRVADRWFRGEGDWLGTAPTPRSTVVLSTLGGLTAGAVALVATGAAVIAVVRPGAPVERPDRAPLLEQALVAGPSKSILLLPGESFSQSFAGVVLPAESRVRVRMTPTLGGASPTSIASIASGERQSEVIVARRTWLELPADSSTDRVVVTNVGEGALAVLGPDPVEVWRPSRAVLGGHARVAAHTTAFVLALVALAFGFGAWMGPGIAASLAFALWLGATMITSTMAMPGGAGLAAALAAVAEGRSPLAPTPAVVAWTVVTLAAGGALCRAALGTWRKETRS